MAIDYRANYATGPGCNRRPLLDFNDGFDRTEASKLYGQQLTIDLENGTVSHCEKCNGYFMPDGGAERLCPRCAPHPDTYCPRCKKYFKAEANEHFCPACTTPKKKKELLMTKPAHEVAYPDKPCIDCGEIYERTSNVQKRCKPCAKKHEAYVPVAQRALATPVTNVPVTGAGDESQTRAPIILPETKLPVQGPGHQVIISEDRVRSALHVLDLNAIQIEAFLALIR